MPLIRYRTGDVARWLPEPCPCGLPLRRLSTLRGRLDEQVSCAWGNLHPDFFEPLLQGVPGLGIDWQVALYERDLTPVVQFRLELEGDGAARERAVQEVLGALQRTRPDAWLVYCQRLLDLELVFFPPGTLRSGRKLLRLVDERLTGPPAWVARAKALGLGGLAESVVEANEVSTGGSPVGPQESSRELERVRSAQRMQEQDARRRLADSIAGLHLEPVIGQPRHGLSRLVLASAREDGIASQPCEGGIALDGGCPPDDDCSVFFRDTSHERSLGFSQAERNDRRGVPELHRSLSRSSRTAFTPAPPGTTG